MEITELRRGVFGLFPRNLNFFERSVQLTVCYGFIAVVGGFCRKCGFGSKNDRFLRKVFCHFLHARSRDKTGGGGNKMLFKKYLLFLFFRNKKILYLCNS